MIISWDAVDWRILVLSIYLLLPVLAVTVIYFDEKSKEKTNRTTLKLLLGTYAIAFSALILMSTLLILPAVGPWKEMKCGTYDHVEYTDTRVKKAPVGYRTIHRTIIHFADGQSVVLPGEYSIEFPKGTELKILTKNDFYKIEKTD